MRREVGGNILKLLFFIGCGYGIVRISIWSFIQTQAFFAPYDTDGTRVISTALALAFQYGQNIALFMAAIGVTKSLAYKNKILSVSGNRIHVNILEEEIRKCERSTFIYYILFTIFALIDAGTNLGQFFVQTVPSAEAKFSGIALTTFIVLGSLLSVVVVFVEELFMDTANAVLHAMNDVLESLGKNRIPSLDLFVDPDKIIAIKLDERGGRSSGESSRGNGGQTQRGNLGNNGSNANRGGGSAKRAQLEHSRNTPKPIQEYSDEGSLPPLTYHPVGMQTNSQQARNNAQDSFDASDFNFEA